MDTEDLEYNAFFSGLKKRFPKLYEKIEESCLTVCVPHSKVLHNFKPSLQFFEKYVLQPSPFFKNEWESISKPPLKCKLQDGNILLVTLPSSEKVNVKILFEESYYNSQLQAHRVICVDNLFESNPSGKLQIQDTAGTSIFDSRSTYKENEGFLVTYTSCMKPLFDRAKEFNESYMVVPGYIDHLVERLQSLRDELREIAFASPRLASVRTDPRLPTSIDDAIECCLFEKVFAKAFEAVALQNEKETREFKSCLLRASRLSQQAIGSMLPTCDLQASISSLRAVSVERSPITKFVALRNVITFLSEEAKRCAAPGFVLTTDELLPLLATTMARCDLPELPAHLDFMERFGWTPGTSPEFSYVSVTARAALALLQSVASGPGVAAPPATAGAAPEPAPLRTTSSSVSLAKPLSALPGPGPRFQSADSLLERPANSPEILGGGRTLSLGSPIGLGLTRSVSSTRSSDRPQSASFVAPSPKPAGGSTSTADTGASRPGPATDSRREVNLTPLATRVHLSDEQLGSVRASMARLGF